MADETNGAGHRRGLMFILSSPSGAGKSTLARRILASDPEIRLSVSATTRTPRAGEVDGEDYHFVSADEFERMATAGEMLEHAVVFGNRYGTPRAPVEKSIEEGGDVIFDVDWQGAQQLRASALGGAVVSVFILPPSIEELHRRLIDRAQDSEEVVRGRMERSRDEIDHWAEYDYVLINDDLRQCQERVESILQAERLRRVRRTGLVDFVNGLNAEFTRKFE